jgi:hypothetical protein
MEYLGGVDNLACRRCEFEVVGDVGVPLDGQLGGHYFYLRDWEAKRVSAGADQNLS